MSQFYSCSCPACKAELTYPADSTLLRCPVCMTISPVNRKNQVPAADPTPPTGVNLPLHAQALKWSAKQLSVFLVSLQLQNLAGWFEYHHVDGMCHCLRCVISFLFAGQQFLELTEEELRMRF